MKYTWDPEYSVEVKEIDKQHKKIFEILERLHVAIRDERTDEFITDIIEQLVSYSIYHFKTEEKYFDKFDYKYTKQHKAQHKGYK